MTRRNLELILLVIAAPIVVILFAMIALKEGEVLSVNTLAVPLGMFASFVVAHFAVRWLAPKADPALLPITFALSGIGLAFVTRLAPELAVRQVMWFFLGVGLMIAVLLIIRNLDKIAKYKYTLAIVGVILLLSPLLPGIGWEQFGSRIWLKIGSFSFQPGELAKIFIVLFLAGYLAQNREILSVFTWKIGPVRLPDFRALLPLLLMWGIALVIVVGQKDLGSALVFFTIFLVMLYAATGKKFYLIVGFLLALAGVFAAFSMFSHVQLRFNIWLDPFEDSLGSGWQLAQGIFSIADGGLFGVGLGNGLAENIDVVESDFIFAAIAEETGLLGAAGLLLLYLCFAVRGIVTAARAKSDVSSLVAVGATAIIILQAFIIVGGITRVIPLTGLTLPFVSQGGSSLVAGFIAVGLLLRCGDEATGVDAEVKSGTTSMDPNSVLGRVSLGKRLTHCMVLFSVMFAILVANLSVIMVLQADYYKNMPENNHTYLKQQKTERGTISTFDGTILAQSVKNDDGTYKRVYPAGTLASHVIGYYSPIYGTNGIEASYNNALQGEENYASWTDVINVASGKQIPGNDVKLTINSKIQQAAQDALDGYDGAAVVMDPETGAVLAMASNPTYNAADVEELLKDATGSALLNRATQRSEAPGSTFKIVSLSSAFENSIASESTVFDSPGVMEIGNADVTSFGKIGYGSITLERAMEVSSNTVFGQLGVQIGSEKLVETAEAFGFNDTPDFDLPLVESQMADPDEMTTNETAWAAVGQPVGDTQGNRSSSLGPTATVLQMAMVGSAIGNDGVIMNPYLVDSIYNAQGERSFSATPTQYKRAISAETAERVKKTMEGVVNSGTGTAAAVSGVQVAGKTGTAETGKANDDSWFVGLAPADNPRVVVAIVLEETGETGTAAARAQNVLKTALEVQGLL